MIIKKKLKSISVPHCQIRLFDCKVEERSVFVNVFIIYVQVVAIGNETLVHKFYKNRLNIKYLKSATMLFTKQKSVPPL